MFRDCCREGYLQSGRIKEAGKFTVFFLPGHGPRLGWTAVAGGPYTCPKNRLCPEAGKKGDRRGRRRSGGGFGVGYLVWGVLMKRSAGAARFQ